MRHSVMSAWRRQHGLSAMGMLLVIILIVSAVTLVLKLAPFYIDYYTIQSVLEDLPANQVRTMSRTSLDDLLKKRFSINNLRGFDIRDIIELDRSREGTALELNYEQREHLFFNIDVVLTFQKRYQY